MQDEEFSELVAELKGFAQQLTSEIAAEIQALKPAKRSDPEALRPLAERHGDRLSRLVLRRLTEALAESRRCPVCDGGDG